MGKQKQHSGFENGKNRLYKWIIIASMMCLNVLIATAQTHTEFIDKIKNYQDSVKLEKGITYDCIDTTTFHLNQYMKMFTKLRLDDKLEYAYECLNNNLEVRLYIYVKPYSFNLDNYLDQEAVKALRNSVRTRIIKEERPRIIHPKPFQFLNDSAFREPEKETIAYDNEEYSNFKRHKLLKFLNDSVNRACRNIIPENSDEGYLQYLYFDKTGEQFTQKWSTNYTEKWIVYSKKDITRIIKEYSKTKSLDTNKKELKKLLKLDPTPLVKSDSTNFKITWIEIETYNGIYERTYKISRTLPHRIALTKEKELVAIAQNFVY